MVKVDQQKKNLRMAIWLVVFLVIGVCLIGCKSSSTPKPSYAEVVTAKALTPKPTQTLVDTKTPGPSPTPAPSKTSLPKVTLICPECAELGIKINIWSTPSREGISGSVPHKTTVSVLETKTYNGILYYKVQRQGIVGWVSELFIKK